MAAQKNGINLLPESRFEKSAWGEFLKWALTFGRWIVIFTELVVILAFLSRFKLDRDLTDLYDRIEQKQAIIESVRTFEEEFRLLQKKIKVIKALEESQLGSEPLLFHLASTIPEDVYLDNLSVSEGELTIEAYALNENGLRNFLTNLMASKEFSDISLGKTEREAEENIIHFYLSAFINKNAS